MLVVRTKKELEQAVKNKVPMFRVEGELVSKVKNGLKFKKFSKITLAILLASVAAVPFTGGTSAAVSFAANAAIGGTAGGVSSITILIAINFLGLALLKAIDKGYTIKFKYDGSVAEFEFKK